MINFIKYKILRREKPKLDYPIPFALIKYTETALQNNIKDDQNKIILKYYKNRYGMTSIKKYKYSEAMVYLLESQGVPVYDKTKQTQRFPVYVREIPGEIIYHK